MHERNDSVAITGLGILSPIGIGQERFWAALCEGISGIRELPGATELPRYGAQVVDYMARDFIGPTHLRRMDKVSRALVSAARMALTDAGLDGAGVEHDDTGIVVGSALGNIDESAQYLARLFTKGPSLASPMMFPNLVLNAPASYAAMETRSTGINLTVSDGEVSAEQALLLATESIRHERAEVVLTGGADEWADIVAHAYRRRRMLAGQVGGPECCRPFDARRNGVVLGEGAAMLVLEPLARARQRGRSGYAVIESVISFGVPSSPYGWPRSGVAAAEQLRAWLERTLPIGAKVDLVVTNANGSRVLDGFLLDVMARLFGETASGVALTSVRGAIGEFGAAGALSLVAATRAVQQQCVPPLAHFEQAPPGSPFQFVAERAVAKSIDRVLHFSVARGGAAVAVLLRRP